MVALLFEAVNLYRPKELAMLEMNFLVSRPRILKPGTVKIRDRKKIEVRRGYRKRRGVMSAGSAKKLE